jgi:hypothetical protein
MRGVVGDSSGENGTILGDFGRFWGVLRVFKVN